MRKPDAWPKPLLKLIETSHSRAAMERFRDYEPDDHAMEVLAEMARGMLTVVPPEGSACAVMSALLAVTLEDPLDTVIPVVAGALKVDAEYMYGSNSGFDGSQVFSSSSDDWDGHCWLLLGRFIVDISLGRTARKGECRAPLARVVIGEFGQHVGLIAVSDAEARRAGLLYLPRYVLTPDQVLGLAGGAIERFGL